MSNDYSELTEVQEARDRAFVNDVRSRLVQPLLAELENAIPGYANMPEKERFAALMKINEVHALKGFPLTLDFGFVDDFGDAKSAVFPGRDDLYTYTEGDVKQYMPFFVDTEGGINGDVVTQNAMLLIDPPEEYGPGITDIYKQLPLPYKVAVVALCLKQNIVISSREACRFAAGWTDSPNISRVLYTAMESGNMQRFGWIVEIRDTMPTNDIGKELARTMRRFASEDSKRFPGWPDGDGVVPLYISDGEQRRARHQSTELLIDFLDRELPAKGYHVGRSGRGKQIPFDVAYAWFTEKYPGYYSDTSSFRNAYYNARKARREGQ